MSPALVIETRATSCLDPPGIVFANVSTMQATSDQHADDSVAILSTESQIHAFDLTHTFRVAIGRHESNDLVLSSRTVSNYHAELVNEDGRLILRDLGSTNGTFLNEKRIRQQSLQTGDRIRIGSYVVTLSLEPPINKQEGLYRILRDPDSFRPGTRGKIISLRADAKDARKTLQGTGLHDVSLADLLKVLSGDAGSVRLYVRSESATSEIWIQNGRIVHAENGDVTGEKALYRVFGWHNAIYEVAEFPEGLSPPKSIDLPADTVIAEGMRQAAEIGKLFSDLPPAETPLRLKEDCPLPPSVYTPAEFQIFQAVIRYETIAAVLEASPLTDERALRLIHTLLRKGIFETVGGSGTPLEETLRNRIARFRP